MHTLPWALPIPVRVLGRHREGALAHPHSATELIVCLGSTRYESHKDERSMAVRWRLERDPGGVAAGDGVGGVKETRAPLA